MKRIRSYIQAVNWRNTLAASLCIVIASIVALIYHPQSLKQISVIAFSVWALSIGRVLLEIWNETD